MLVFGLSTGHKLGLVLVALAFVGFSLVSSFVAPRRWPGYPGRFFSVFVVACFVLFALMLGAVQVFGGESETASAEQLAKGGEVRGTIDVSEKEWRIVLPTKTAKELQGGTYTFHVTNAGKVPHNLTINGPHVQNEHTPNLQPGASANLRVILVTGMYDLYCSIPGHKQLGMDAKLSVG